MTNQVQGHEQPNQANDGIEEISKSLKITFEAIRNAGLSASLLGGGAYLLRNPELVLGYQWLALFEAILLIIMSTGLQILNVIDWAYRMSFRRIPKWWFVIGGTIFVVLMLHFYGAVGMMAIDSAKEVFQK